ncbi:unnamed protein product [Ascophyllum nodosum]
MRRRKRVGDRSVLPFVCMWACSTLWIVYGLFSGDIFPTVVTNLCGSLFSMYYCAVFAWAAESPSRKNEALNLFAGAFLMVCTVSTYCMGAFSPDPKAVTDDRVQRHAGIAASAFTVVQYASPLADFVKVFNRQSTEGLSRPLATISLICAALWVIYGMLTENWFVLVPNSLGVAFSAAQFVLFWMFPRNRRKSQGNSATNINKAVV